MRQLIIIFEFQQSNIYKIDSFKNILRQYGKFAFITSNSCIIWTNDSEVTVRDNLRTQISFEDKIFVASISSPAAWVTSLSQEVSDFLKQNLR
jgi:hypothetical protein